MLRIHFAPMQGVTDARFRRQHFLQQGGVDCYYTPFLRWERNGVRPKDRRDVLPTANQGVPVVPQVIAANRDEFCRLCDFLQKLGWTSIDLNMGCPFPMQTGHGRGAGLLQYPDRVEAILQEMTSRGEVSFSIKMRLGQQSPDEAFALIPMLNEAPLHHVTLHPRLGIQQYSGTPDRDSFARFYALLQHPLVYNGDIVAANQVYRLEKDFPDLEGVMIGRALVEHPDLARVIKSR